MNLKRKIFWRITAPLACSILIMGILISYFLLKAHRIQARQIYTTQANFLAQKAENMLMWDDRLGLRKIFLSAVQTTPVLKYVFLERNGEPYVHSFQTGMPRGLLDRHADIITTPLFREIEDEEGSVFYDIAVPVGDQQAVLHAGFSRDAIDRTAHASMITVVIVSASMLIFGIILASVIATATTREIRLLTGELEQSRLELEKKVEERTESLRKTNEQLLSEIAERREVEESLRKTEQELTMRNQISHIFLSVPDREMFGEVLNVVLDVLKSPYGIFGYIDKNGHFVCPSLTRDVWSQCQMQDKEIVFPMEKWGGVWGRALVEKKTLCTNSPLPVPEGHIPITRALVVPVLHQGVLIGNLIVANKESDYDQKDHVLLETIAQHIAPVLAARLERERLEEQLRQSQKMEAIGQLAGGIAHDFNNILTAIIGYSSFLKMELQEADPLYGDVTQIVSSAERAAQLTKGLLALSRQQIISPKPTRLNAVVSSMVSLLSRIIGEDIELKTALAVDDPVILADRGQIEQILINLATNARDAMPDGGVLSISTQTVLLDREFISAQGFEMQPGLYVLLSVTDSGTGIDERIRERIFEPFFTTKEVGKGTGLGLSIVYGIIQQHNGYIGVESQPGKGATFQIYFSPEEALPEEAGEKTVSLPARGTETILLAEDETDVRNLLRLALTQNGYKVISAENGEAAIEKFIQNREQIQLLVFDVIMPKKNGIEAFHEIKKINPDTKIIFLSGYTAALIESKGISEEGFNLVTKPIAPNDLLTKVREVLDR